MSLEVGPVRGRWALSRFIGLPWRLFDLERWPHWIPPLRASVADALDRKGNPFYREADRELFLAYRDGRPVGRIAAIENRRHNEFHQDRVGFFGFFECADDPEAAAALFDAASAWLAERGLDRARGPMSPSTNHECGLLVDGFDSHTSFMTTWNPPYYEPLLERAGFEKAKDLLAFWVPTDGRLAQPERLRRTIERARARSGLTFRLIDTGDFAREAERVWDVYNAAWERNWGFVPMSRAEFDHMAGMLKLLLVDEFVHFAEVDGEPVGITVSLPDYNLTLRRVPSGRLLPALPKLLLDRRRLRRGRLMMLGVKKGFRGQAAYLTLLDESLRRARAYGAEGAEASWILEDNEDVIGFFRQTGIAPTKRWRIYDRMIATPSEPPRGVPL